MRTCRVGDRDGVCRYDQRKFILSENRDRRIVNEVRSTVAIDMRFFPDTSLSRASFRPWAEYER